MCAGVEPEGWFGCFAHCFGGVECRGHAHYDAFVRDPLLLLPALQKWQLGSLVSLNLFVQNLHAVIFSPL